MSIFRSLFRFVTTLGGLLSSKVDEGTDALLTTPAGIKAAFKSTRDTWTRQYHEVRDAVSQLLMVMEQKRAEIEKLQQELKDAEIRKRGAVEKFKATKEEKYQVAFSQTHTRIGEIEARLQVLNTEVVQMEKRVDGYKLRLTEMQANINKLEKQEAEAIADIVSGKQIVDLNDRLQNLSTSLHDQNLQAIEKARQKVTAKAKLSDQLAGTDTAQIDREVMAAGLSGDAADEFSRMLAESELKAKERGVGAGPTTERAM